MKQKSFYIYIAAYLAILIPAPGRFVFGFTLLLELALLMLSGVLVNFLVAKLKLEEFKSTFIFFVLISETVLYRQIFVFAQPEIALTLGFTFYLPTISLFLIGFILEQQPLDLKNNLLHFVHELLYFILSGLLFFLFRDIFGYGTFTFYGPKNQIFEKIIFPTDKVGIFSFFATIPGALFLQGIFLALNVIIKQKFKVIENSEAQK